MNSSLGSHKTVALFVLRIAYCVSREEGRRQKKIISRQKVEVGFIEHVSGRINSTPTPDLWE